RPTGSDHAEGSATQARHAARPRQDERPFGVRPFWWINLDRRLSTKARRAISDSENEVHVSAASVWEIGIKVSRGKLTWPERAGSIREYVLGQEFRPLPISLDHAERASRLDFNHWDPFDRMLMAQSLAQDLWLVSNETLFDAAGVRRYW